MRAWLAIAMISLLMTGCGEQQKAYENHSHATGDIQETTASIEVLPTFLDGLHDNIGKVYAIAGQNAELLDWIPCYCGCGESAGHLSNKNCFIKAVHDDGSVVWDDHGTRCGVCMEIAIQAAKMKEEGKSVKEIRTLIDAAYKEGYAAPTKTPMPV
ncbi:PCYCGC motif-containing (lipo)protein [Paenibacillus thailandensis]|uniref:PCYCGC motif-containing (Lipo)protein n=1 Tax=Paenibacillus thailandensis TaxID=393250 RepID=A0ABW5QYU0_9BACL